MVWCAGSLASQTLLPESKACAEKGLACETSVLDVSDAKDLLLNNSW